MGFKEKILEYSLIKEQNEQKIKDNYSGFKELYKQNKFGFFIAVGAYSLLSGLIILFSIKLIKHIIRFLF